MDIRTVALDLYQKALNADLPAAGFDNLPPGFSPQETAFVKRLLLTTLRRQEFLRRVINTYAGKKLPARPNTAQLAMLMGAAEILYFHTPDYAVVNSYVNLAKKKGNRYAGGFVNAVLRKICRDGGQIVADDDNHGFFPQAFTSLLRRDYGKKTVAAVESAAMTEAPLDITVKQDPAGWAKTLGGKLMGNGSIRLYNTGAVNRLPGFEDGSWWVQDLASSLAVIALGDIRGKTVLDLCAAPGGKTAQLINAGASVTALDISSSRLDILRQNLKRLNLPAQEIIAEDALQYLKTAPAYDIILVDAPCSATGTLRRHPEIVHTRSAKDVDANARIQRQLLESAGNALKPGGILLYAVCSLCKDEGEKQINDFVTSHSCFKLLPIAENEINRFGQAGFNDLITSEGYIRCLPSYLAAEGGMDGFFVAKLQKEH